MPDYRWTPVNEKAPFAPRDGAGALTFNGRMWLLGGWNPFDKINFPKVCNSEVWSSADGVGWTRHLKQAPWEPRHTAGYAIHDNKMWIVGGDANQGHYQHDVWSSHDGVDWRLATDRVPWGPRVLHHTVSFKNRLWVFGGQTLPQFAPEKEAFYADAWCSSDGAEWHKMADNLPWAPRGMIGGAAVLHDKIWLLGGGTYDTPLKPDRNFYNDVWSSTDGVNWQQTASKTPWTPRQYHDVITFDNRLWVTQGYNAKGGNRNDVWHSADGINWEEVPNTPWAPRHASGLYVHDNALWMIAGNNMTPDVWKLTRNA
jgi:hypothetical protein